MRSRHVPLAALLALLIPNLAGAQSLADVARSEEARRKNIKATGKVYTNTDLKNGGDNASASAVPAAPATQASAAKPETEKPQPKEEARKDEKHWRDRMTALRNAISRNKILADALQSRLNALNTDFMNRDDPMQRAALSQDRKAALAEMDRVKQDTEKQNKAIADLEEEARKANVPAGWLR